MSANRPNHNSCNTQLIWSGTKQLLTLDLPLLTSLRHQFTFSSSVRVMGFTLDCTLSFSEHLCHLKRSCLYHLRRLRAIRRSVSSAVFTTIVQAFVCSRIDYCNSLLPELPVLRLSSLESGLLTVSLALSI